VAIKVPKYVRLGLWLGLGLGLWLGLGLGLSKINVALFELDYIVKHGYHSAAVKSVK